MQKQVSETLLQVCARLELHDYYFNFRNSKPYFALRKMENPNIVNKGWSDRRWHNGEPDHMKETTYEDCFDLTIDPKKEILEIQLFRKDYNDRMEKDCWFHVKIDPTTDYYFQYIEPVLRKGLVEHARRKFEEEEAARAAARIVQIYEGLFDHETNLRK